MNERIDSKPPANGAPAERAETRHSDSTGENETRHTTSGTGSESPVASVDPAHIAIDSRLLGLTAAVLLQARLNSPEYRKQQLRAAIITEELAFRIELGCTKEEIELIRERAAADIAQLREDQLELYLTDSKRTARHRARLAGQRRNKRNKPQINPMESSRKLLTGGKVGRLTPQWPFKFDIDVHRIDLQQHHGKWQCLCDCGNTAYVRKQHLLTHKVQSCGCLQRELRSKGKRDFIGAFSATAVNPADERSE